MLNKGLDGVSTKELREIKCFLSDIASSIQENRKLAGYSQESFAELLNINVNTVKYIEQGRRIPSIPMLFRICKALKIEFKLG